MIVVLALACAGADKGPSSTTFATTIGGPGGDDGGGTTEASDGSDGLGTFNAATGESGDEDTTGAAETTGAAPTTGPPPPSSYPPCVDGTCLAGNCVDFEDGNVCLPPCTDAAMCPSPSDGNAAPVCESFDPLPDSCALDCAEGQACPEGMLCDLVIGSGAFCVWP